MTNTEKEKLQKKILEALPSKPHGRLLLAPRIGKTKIAIDIIVREEVETILWVTPSSNLGQRDIPAEFIKWGAEKHLKGLTTCTWKSLHKIEGHFDMIILDEEQYITELNSANLLTNDVLTCGSLITMTGTPTKSVLKNKIYQQLELDVLYTLSINDAVDMGMLANYELNVIVTEMSGQKNILSGSKEKPFYTSECKLYQYLNAQAEKASDDKRHMKIMKRRKAISESPAKVALAKSMIANLKGRKLVFCANHKQAEDLSNDFYHGKSSDKSLDAFQNREIETLALVNKGGVGYTFTEIDHLIVIQTDSDKNGLTSQKIARTLLEQGDYKAKIWILCLACTKDVIWVNDLLSNFDKTKIKTYEAKKIKPWEINN